MDDEIGSQYSIEKTSFSFDSKFGQGNIFIRLWKLNLDSRVDFRDVQGKVEYPVLDAAVSRLMTHEFAIERSKDEFVETLVC